MRVVLQVSSGNGDWDAGCEFALVDLTGDLAALALQRVRALKDQKSTDPNIDEIYYWDYSAQYFSPWAGLASTENEGGAASPELTAVLDEAEAKGVVTVPENFDVPQGQLARVECQQMVVCQDSVRFIAIPKHASFYVQTAEIPVPTLEAAVCRPTCG
jgi:hypothetical protein